MKISELPAASALTGAELLPVVQSGTTKQTTIADIGGSSLGWFNVQDYGAVGDGVTNDTASIQAAVDAAEAAGGGTIYFPRASDPDYYLLSDTIILSNINLYIALVGDDSQIRGTVDGYLIERQGLGSGNVFVSYLKFANDHANGSCLCLRGGGVSSVRGCSVNGGRIYGIDCRFGFSMLIENTNFMNCGIAIVTTGHTLISCCDVTANTEGVRAIGANSSMIGCRFEVNETAVVLGRDVDDVASALSSTVLVGNTFEANDTAIDTTVLTSSVISGSLVQGTVGAPSGSSQYGIRARNLDSCIIQNCVFSGGFDFSAVELSGPLSYTTVSNVTAFNTFSGASVAWDIQTGGADFNNCNQPIPELATTDLMTNGDFASSDVSAWYRGSGSANGTLAVVSGALVHTAGSSEVSGFPRWMFPVRNVVEGETYRMAVGSVSGTCSDKRVTFGTDATGNDADPIFGAGSLDVVATGPILYIGSLMASPTLGQTIIIDDITVVLVPAAVTQLTSRTTGVTLNRRYGAITLFSAAGSATFVTFAVTNSTVAATDTVVVSQKSGTDVYDIQVTAIAAGSFNISCRTTGATTEQPVFNFVVVSP